MDELCDERYANPFAKIQGREQLRAAVKKAACDPSFADTVTILDMVAEGDKVAVRMKHPDGREQVTLYAALANG